MLDRQAPVCALLTEQALEAQCYLPAAAVGCCPAPRDRITHLLTGRSSWGLNAGVSEGRREEAGRLSSRSKGGDVR